MARNKFKIGSVAEDLHDARLPEALGTAGQVPKINSAGTGFEYGDVGAGTFIATYGTSTATEVATAITAGRSVGCYYAYTENDKHWLALVDETDSKYVFSEASVSSSDNSTAVSGLSAALNKTTNEWQIISGGAVIPTFPATIENDRYLHTNASTGVLEWTDISASEIAEKMEGGSLLSADLNETQDKVNVHFDLTGATAGQVPKINSTGNGISWGAPAVWGSITGTLGDQEDLAQAIEVLDNDITEIQGLIPNQASSENQLGDKDFINSSIATNTSTFRGTSASGLTEAEFLAWADTLTKTNNDYVFWNTVDDSGNTQYKRYKYNGSSWTYEYTLNNSSFTSNQWASINSGVTDENVTDLTDHLANTSNPHSVTKDQVGFTNLSNPRTADGVWIAKNVKHMYLFSGDSTSEDMGKGIRVSLNANNTFDSSYTIYGPSGKGGIPVNYFVAWNGKALQTGQYDTIGTVSQIAGWFGVSVDTSNATAVFNFKKHITCQIIIQNGSTPSVAVPTWIGGTLYAYMVAGSTDATNTFFTTYTYTWGGQ